MLKKILFAFTIIFNSFSVFSQNLDWAQRAGGNGSDIGHSIAENSQGEVIAVGWFAGNSSFGKGASSVNLNSAGLDDGYIVKFDSYGNLIWAKSIKGSAYSQVLALELDENDNIFITGQFSGSVDFDPDSNSNHIISSNGQYDVFVGKYTTHGDLIWVKSFGGFSNETGTSVTIDRLGNVYTTGFFHGTVDFNPGTGSRLLSTPSSTNPDVFISKLDSLGNFVWAKQIEGSGQDLGYHIICDTTSHLYLTGSFNGVADFNPNNNLTYNINAGGSIDAFILKLDTSGSFVWAKNYGGSGSAKGYSIRADKYGNVYSTGYFTNVVNFDSVQVVANGAEDVYALKIKNDGTFLWVKQIGGTGEDHGRSIDVDLEGNVYFAGYFSNIVDFNPGASLSLDTSNGGKDAFVAKFDSLGNFRWNISAGGSGPDHVNRVKLFRSKVYLTGKFQNSMDIDPDTNSFFLTSASTNTNDIFFAKYLQCSSTNSQQSVIACNSYVSPSEKYIWTNGGVYKDTILNVGGCDSIITINLQINTSTSNVIIETACDSYVSPSGKYIWTNSGTYTDTIMNANGCDSTLIIGLILNSSTSDTIVENICNQNYYVSPSTKYQWTTSGIYNDTIQNAEGCDSILTIDLSFNSPDTSVSVFGDSLVANQSGANYQWIDCANNYTPIIGASQRGYKPSSNGNYAVVITLNNCIDTSSCHQLITTGLKKHLNQDFISVYPNPSNGVFYLKMNEQADIFLYDASGKVVYLNSSAYGKIEIDISDFSDGVYYLKGISSENVYYKKLIVSK